jgi:hypothetical protein
MLKILQVDDSHDVTFKSKTVIITMTMFVCMDLRFIRLDIRLDLILF